MPEIRPGVFPVRNQAVSAESFSRQFRHYILLTWNVPPVFGLAFLLFIRMFTPGQILAIMVTPLEPAFIFGSMLFAHWYFRRFALPIRAYLADPTPAGAHAPFPARLLGGSFSPTCCWRRPRWW